MGTQVNSNTVRSLWVPLQGLNLLIPNAAVIEIIGYQPYALVESAQQWMLGSLRWRGKYLPVVSMEGLCGEGLPMSTGSSRLAIFNAIRSDTSIDFYAIVTADIPRLIHIDENIQAAPESEDELSTTVVCKAVIADEQATIPDLETIQLKIDNAWKALI